VGSTYWPSLAGTKFERCQESGIVAFADYAVNDILYLQNAQIEKSSGFAAYYGLVYDLGNNMTGNITTKVTGPVSDSSQITANFYSTLTELQAQEQIKDIR
jgi:hypothetical protein